jgi:hypothetical protein
MIARVGVLRLAQRLDRFAGSPSAFLIQAVCAPILVSMHNFWNDEILIVHHGAWQRL